MMREKILIREYTNSLMNKFLFLIKDGGEIMANIITGFRILCAIILIFVSTNSPEFYASYILGGFTDMIDGTVARKTNSTSEFGSKLDTLADFIFIVVCLLKILPMFTFPKWIWIWFACIAIIKIINIVSAFIVHKKFVAEHTVLNKTTGLLMFLLPIVVYYIPLIYCASVVCIIATIAAIQEGHYIRIGIFY